MGMTPQYFHTIPISCAILSTTYALCGIYHFVAAEGNLSMFYYYGWPCCSQTSRRSSMIIMGIHCYFTQEDRRAFKATPVESIYATLSEVSGHILLWYKSKVGCFGTTLPILPPPRASMLLLGQTPHSLRRLLLTGVLPRTLRASTSS